MHSAIAQAAINGNGSLQALNWLQCSKRSILTRLRNGTFQRSRAVTLLRGNARDFARCNGLAYDATALDQAAELICDWILTVAHSSDTVTE